MRGRMYDVRRTLMILSVVVCLGSIAGAENVLNEATKLLDSDGAISDGFGSSVCVSGDVCVVGVPNDREQGLSTGSACVYRHDAEGSAWTQEAKLIASGLNAHEGFALSVAIAGDVCVVGAGGNDNENGENAGAVYVFRHDSETSTWGQEVALLASDGAEGEAFGRSVSISDNVLIVGASYHDFFASGGAAYIFRYDEETGNWVEEARLSASDGAGRDEFGSSVSISGDVCVVVAKSDDDNGEDSGSAYVFRYDAEGEAWNQEAKLLPSDGGPSYGYFGTTISISGDACVVGTYGGAHVYRYDATDETWGEESKILPPGGPSGNSNSFGNAASISGDACVVSFDADDDNGTLSGSAYVFRHDAEGETWNQEAKLLASDGAASDYLGSAISISGRVCLIGAPFDDEKGLGSGSAYVFELSTSVTEINFSQPASLSLSQNTPNPFNPSTTITFAVPTTGAVDLSVFNVQGQLVRTLVDAEMPAGSHAAVWNGRDMQGRPAASGVYLYRLTGTDGTLVKRMVLVR